MVAFHILMWHESVMFRESLNCYGTLTVLEPLCATPGLQCNEACDAIATEGEMPLTTTQHTHTHTHKHTHTQHTPTYATHSWTFRCCICIFAFLFIFCCS